MGGQATFAEAGRRHMQQLTLTSPLTSPLTLLAAPRADRANILVDFLLEDFAGLDLNSPPWLPLVTRSERTEGERPNGPTLDPVTRARLHALAGTLGLSAAEADEWFTEYWLIYTVLSAYVRPLQYSGRNFLQLIARLDRLTQRASLMLPRWRLPGLECFAVSEHSLVIRRREDRPRAARFVLGLQIGRAHV